MVTRIVFAFVASFFAFSAFADVQPATYVDLDVCTRYAMCLDKSGTGACQTGGDEVVLGPLGLASISFSLDGSAAGVTANLEESSFGHDTVSGVGTDVFAAEVAVGEKGKAVGVYEYIWVDVSANPSNNADAYVTVCRPSSGTMR